MTDTLHLMNPDLRREVSSLREGIASAAERAQMPERFVAYPGDGPFMVITDTETMRSAKIALCNYGAVRETLQALFA